jgi:aspartyl-tRNA(Asn)/glutamyl-tRNA(Gln) amidotransferase subunit A
MTTPDFPWALSATELLRLYRARELSPVEVVDAILARVGALDPELHAYMSVTAEAALDQARLAEAAYLGEGDPDDGRRLLGIPVSVKDNLPTAGIRTTMGSLLHEDWIPDFDALAVERARRAGAVILGKTNTSEFGWKGDAGNLLIGPTRNPWNRELTAGGSSGGAAAALASGLGPLALGTDGAGSLRIPAAFCGVVGYKPAQGTVPVYPPSGIGTLSHHGPMARTVADVELLTGVLAGADARDRFSVPAQLGALDSERLAGLRVAWSPTLGYARVEQEVLARTAESVRAFEELGCHVEEVDPGFDDPHDSLWAILTAAQAAQHADDLDAVRDRIDPGRLELVLAGRSLSATDLSLARRERQRFYDEVRLFMDGWDLLVTPTMPITAFEAGPDMPHAVGGEPTSGLRWSPFTYPFNLTGNPAMSVPCGFAGGMPVGLQLVGRWRRDDVVIGAARAFESVRPWETLAP